MVGFGLNVSRELNSGRNAVNSVQTQGTPPLIHRVVVVEVYYDPYSLTDDEKRQLKTQVTNPQLVDNMPQNSILGRVVSNQQDLTDPTPSIFYPFFSSHMQLPIQPGEQAYVIYEDYTNQENILGKWIDRVSENSAVEDVNYTHSDRRFDPRLVQDYRRLSDQQQQETSPPGFPNGGNNPTSFTLHLSGSSTTNPYEQIVQQSLSYRLFTPEPVPRYIKRPGEYVLQGMNNSLIVLGDDRTSSAIRSSDRDQVGQSGIIDIVVGRGRLPHEEQTNTTPDQKPTNSINVRNTRGSLEVDKTPSQRNRRKNPREGDRDLKRDAARLFVTMNSAVDQNFRLQHSTNPEQGFEYPDNTIRPTQSPVNANGIDRSYAVAKADHIRIVARKEVDPRINGTILILREGIKDDDLAFLYMEGGKVQLESKEIYLGKSTQKSEPYIKWTVYESHINELKAQIRSLANHVQRLTELYSIAFQASVTVPLTPVASLAAAGPSTQSATTAVVRLIGTRLDTINPADAKSIKVFGE